MPTEAIARAEAPSESSPIAVVQMDDHHALEWDAFVSRHPGTGYHIWAWRGVFERAFGHRCIYLAARRGGNIVGALPLVHMQSRLFGRTLNSLPFLNYGGVISERREADHALVIAATELARKLRCSHVELRHSRRIFEDLPCRQHKVAMLLPLAEGMWDRIDRKVRNQIRKAEKSDLTVARGGADLLPEFYTVFSRNMRDLGTPVYSRRLFEEVLRALAERTSIHVVRHRGAAIAAALTYRSGEVVEVPWASSLREHNPRCPNYLLYWSIIEAAVAEGAEVLDFGRSSPHEGTYKFKEQWGAQPQPLYWEYQLLNGQDLPDVSPKNPKFKLAIDGWRRLPVWLTNALGPHIVRSIP